MLTWPLSSGEGNGVVSDALEAGGSYSKSEITERDSKYREKLMQVCVCLPACLPACG